MRITACVTNIKRGQLADLELRHRRRAGAEDRIRAAKTPGRHNLPLPDFTQSGSRLAAETAAPPPALDPGPPRPHRPPPAASPGRHRTVHRARPSPLDALAQ